MCLQNTHEQLCEIARDGPEFKSNSKTLEDISEIPLTTYRSFYNTSEYFAVQVGRDLMMC